MNPIFVDHRVARATLQQPEAYLVTMPPHWANAHEGCTFRPWVGSATTLPEPYKHVGLWAGRLPHCKVTFCPSPKSQGHVDNSPLVNAVQSPNNFKPP